LYAQDAGEPGGFGAEVTEDIDVGSMADVSEMATARWGTPAAYNKLSDPDTSNASTTFPATTLENGKLWVDKSVNKESASVLNLKGDRVGSAITAKNDQFLVTLSAQSEAYSLQPIITPLDVVFIVDVSGSMTYYAVGANETANYETEAPTKEQTRVYAMSEALNQAVEILMDANPANRVAVVAYGGEPGRIPHTYPILALDHYSPAADDTYFNVDWQSLGVANFNVTPGVTGDNVGAVPVTTAPVSGGTPTQRGIIQGAQILMNQSATDMEYTDPATGITAIRKPIMILLTDGEPTFGWTDYINAQNSVGIDGSHPNSTQDWGDAITATTGIDLLTVATASYWKQQVQDHYYPGDADNKLEFYTIGMFMDNAHTRAVLNPGGPPLSGSGTSASNNIELYNGTNYNMGTLMNRFVGTQNSTGNFPVLTRTFGGPPNPGRTLISIPNSGGLKSYFYNDDFYQANQASDLAAAFQSVADQIIASGYYITEIGSDPKFSGYLTFSDVIGQYLEFKSYEGLWFYDPAAKTYRQYTGASFAQDISRGSASPNWTAFTTNLATQMDDGTGAVSQAAAADVVNSCIKAGTLYYRNGSNWGNHIRWYADALKNYVAPYYYSDGTVVTPVPANAQCIMDIYPISGTGSVTGIGGSSDLTLVCLVVLTALNAGPFADADNGTSTVSRTLIAGQQIVRWYVPASMIPMRSVDATFDSTGKISSASIVESNPIRAIYSLGFQGPGQFPYPLNETMPYLKTTGNASQPPLSIPVMDAAYKAANRSPFEPKTPMDNSLYSQGFGARYNFYTNQWEVPDTNITMMFCDINHRNPYYYYTSNTPLYKPDGGGGYIPTVAGDTYAANGPFYIMEEYFDSTKAPDYLQYKYTEIANLNIGANGAGVPTINSGPSGYVEKASNIPEMLTPVSKTLTRANPGNITTTLDYSLQINAIADPTDNPVQVRLLGNNGSLSVPVTQVQLLKEWDVGMQEVPVQVQLYSKVGSAAKTPVDNPVTLNGSETPTPWYYEWYPVTDGRELLVYSSLYPASNGNLTTIDYSVQELPVNGVYAHYGNPVWNANDGIWELEIMNRNTPPRPPSSPPPPGSNANTGDGFDLLTWWLLLFVAALGLCLIYKAVESYRWRRHRAVE